MTQVSSPPPRLSVEETLASVGMRLDEVEPMGAEEVFAALSRVAAELDDVVTSNSSFLDETAVRAGHTNEVSAANRARLDGLLEAARRNSYGWPHQALTA